MARGKNVIKVLNRKIKFEKAVIILLYAIAIIISASLFIIKNKLGREEHQEIPEVIIEEEFTESQTGKTYYISADGDSEDGTDINEPMSLNIANNKKFNGNDKVLFKSGDTFYGQINFDIETIDNSLFYIGSYGEGEKPIISGARILKNKDAWILEDGLYKIDLSKTEYFEGLENWGNLKNYCNIGFLADKKGNIYGNRKQNKDSIVNEFDFFCESQFLYIKSATNPTDKLGQIKFVCNLNLVSVSSNCVIENINIQYTGAHGIKHKNIITNNVIIRNCIIQNIGGSVQNENNFTRYGNGIEFWNQAKDTVIEKCIIRDIYDAGYTLQGNTITTELGYENNICRDDIFLRCTYDVEMFCRNKLNGTETCKLKGQYIYDNISINQGNTWGFKARLDKTIAATFVISHFQEKNTQIDFYANRYFNPIRLHYIYSHISTDKFKKYIHSNDNMFYLNEKTYIVRDLGKYADMEILNKYGIDQDSTFNLLSDDELEVINNEYIQNLNDYNKIKAYYMFLDGAQYKNKVDFGPIKGYKYNKDGQDVILVYNENEENKIPYTTYTATNIYGVGIENDGTLEIDKEPILISNLDEETLYPNIAKEIKDASNEFLQKYNSNLLTANMSKVKSQIENLIAEADLLPTYTQVIEKAKVTEIIQKTYEQGENIITALKTEEITDYQKATNMLVGINDIANKIKKLYVTASGDDMTFDKQVEIATNISNFANNYQYYKDDGIDYIAQFYNIAKQNSENNIKDISTYYLASWSNSILDEYNREYISKVNVGIYYEPKELTNQNVKVTISSNVNIDIASKDYTIEKNGTYTYEYKVKGQKFTKSITVTNIDKTLPTITGIENDTVYLESVIPIVQDENLEKVELYRDSNKVENYVENTTITEDGSYKLVALDKAGNKSETEFDIYRIPATIEYSTTNLTNKDVIATIKSKANIQVQNNNQNREYAFKQNGNFTFEYKIRNQTFSIQAEVNNIDKDLPTITGIEQDRVYIDEATPTVSDTNLEKVVLYMNDEEVKNYKPGTKLTKEGLYQIIAKDKAQNETKVNFAIMENENKEYKIKNSYVVNIAGYTRKNEFDKNLKMNVPYEILRNGKPIAEDEKIATGDILKTRNGQEYTIIVKGDINKDGKVNIVDVIKLRNYLLTLKGLDELELKAADCNLDEKNISIVDLIRLRIIILSENAK